MDIFVKTCIYLTIMTYSVSGSIDPGFGFGLGPPSLPGLNNYGPFNRPLPHEGGRHFGEKAESAVKSKAQHVVESFKVMTDIRFRFATTTMVSVIRNTASTAQEVGFDVILPKEAFIMHFAMTIDNKTYDGEVKEKKAAKEQYQAAVDRGQSAGHVRQAARHANVFEVSVNVASNKSVTFSLSYQELLSRKRGQYEYELHVQPGQPVDNFWVQVKIKENQPLKYVRTPSLRTNELISNEIEEPNELTLIDRPTPETATVLYQPSLKDQGEAGVKGRFVVQYDVDHNPNGDLLVVDGYFVHFFSPKLPPMPKDIVFVLDLSGSMSGTKLAQLKKAMEVILNDLLPDDSFNIITFSSAVDKWRKNFVTVSEKTNIKDALRFINDMNANGMTNINSALTTAVKEFYFPNSNSDKQARASLVFFLTDGQPTEGVQDAKKICENVRRANEKNVAILSLAFGDGADFESLKEISAQNNGFARKIYEASDAALQVSSLYNEVSAVVMKNLTVSYLPSKVDEFKLTEQEFPVVYNGTEIVICGFMPRVEGNFAAQITGIKDSGNVDIVFDTNDITKFVIEEEEIKIDITDIKEGGTKTNESISELGPRNFAGLLERMWAFVTIKQLIKERERKADTPESEKLKKKIIDLSLKYKLVTPLTSMVVTKPDTEEKTQASLEDALSERPHRNALSTYSHKRYMMPMSPSGITGPVGSRRKSMGGFNRLKGTSYYQDPNVHLVYDDFFDVMPSTSTTRRPPTRRPPTRRPPTRRPTTRRPTKQTSKRCLPPLSRVNCFIDPCETAMCPAFPKAECRSNYCGGCNHEFWIRNKEVTSKCQKKKNKKTIKVQDSILTGLIVKSNEDFKSGCAVLKKMEAGKYLLKKVETKGIDIFMETYCPDKRCRKIGIKSLTIEASNTVPKQTLNITLKPSMLSWPKAGNVDGIQIKESLKKLTITGHHMMIVLKRLRTKKFDKYVITFDVDDSASHFGMLDAVLNINQKKSRKKNQKKAKKSPRFCSKAKTDVFMILKGKNLTMYKY